VLHGTPRHCPRNLVRPVCDASVCPTPRIDEWTLMSTHGAAAPAAEPPRTRPSTSCRLSVVRHRRPPPRTHRASSRSGRAVARATTSRLQFDTLAEARMEAALALQSSWQTLVAARVELLLLRTRHSGPDTPTRLPTAAGPDPSGGSSSRQCQVQWCCYPRRLHCYRPVPRHPPEQAAVRTISGCINPPRSAEGGGPHAVLL